MICKYNTSQKYRTRWLFSFAKNTSKRFGNIINLKTAVLKIGFPLANSFYSRSALLLFFGTMYAYQAHAQFKTTYYSNGKTKSEGCHSVKDTLKQGPWRLYYNTGKMNAEGSYFYGKMHGEWKYYNFNTGTLEKSERWKDGIQQGEQREFYPTGQLFRSIYFINGVYDGASTSFHTNGKLKSKGLYNAGIPEGVWEDFDEQGNAIVEKTPEAMLEPKKKLKRRRERRK